MRAPTALLTDLRLGPLGCSSQTAPRLSWQVGEGMQAGWHAQVASSRRALSDGAPDVWDSGVVASTASTGVECGGAALAPATRYHWRVRTFDSFGAVSPWSAAATFGTGPAPWSAIPIWAPSGDWAFLRGAVALDAAPISWATVYAAARSSAPARQYVFRLYVNGAVVGVGPSWATGDETFYQAYDVSALVAAGRENVVAAVAHTTAEHAFLAQLVVEHADGRRAVFGTGEDWRARSGGEVYPDSGSVGTSYYTAPTENLDARAWPVGFDAPGFDDSDWPRAAARPELRGLKPLPADNLIERPAAPATVTAAGANRWLVDFGRAWAGGLLLRVDGAAGDEIDVCVGEERTADRAIVAPMRTGNDYRERWTLRAGRQELRHWGYRVFRHAEISGLERLVPADVSALALVYPFDRSAAAFSSSDEGLNQLWRFCRDSIEALNLDLYMDSATRERQPYEADAYLQMLAHLSLDRGWALARHSIEWLLPPERATWPTEWKLYSVLAAREYWMHTGDVEWLSEVYPLLLAKLPTRYVNEDGLVEKPVKTEDFGADIVDWPPSDRDGYVFTDVNTVVNAFAFRAFADMAEMAAALGHGDDADEFGRRSARLQAAVNAQLFDSAVGAYRDGRGVDHHSAHASIYPVALGVATDRETPAAVDYVAARGMACSIFGAPFLVEALYRGGRADDGLRVLTSRGPRSWLHMIEQGAGATMESWSPTVKPNTSYSHPAGASPAFLTAREIFGIRPTSPGFSTFAIAPRPGGLAQAEITVPTVKGPIQTSFRSSPGRLEIGCQVPPNTVATLALATLSEVEVEVDGRRPTTRADGSAVIDSLGPGPHRVRVFDRS